MTRQDYNMKIVAALSDAIIKHPELRFGQILVNMGIIDYVEGGTMEPKDPFHEESKIIFQRMKNLES